ncbi:MAG: FKBP-type peptidyl-prolyl cis-trans isomerase [Candidatus Asgardarchaeia archaeon]
MSEGVGEVAKSSEDMVKDGDFVLVEYDAWEKESNKIFDTTSEEKAKENDIYDEGEVYGPKLVVIGEGWYLKKFEDNLKGLKVGDKVKFEIPPEDAFGKRDPSKIERISIRKFRREGIEPNPRMRVRVGNRVGTVIHVGAGRVLVDFNHPLAGKTLVYEAEVKKILKEFKDKVRYLIRRRIADIELNKVKVLKKGKTVSIELPEDVLYSRDVHIAKRGIAQDLFKYFGDIDRVRFIEELKREKKGEVLEEKKSEKTPESSEKSE